MRRNVYDKIVAWHKARKRKPLVLMGARQVGKTWLMEHFAAEYYPQDYDVINDVTVFAVPSNVARRASSCWLPTVEPQNFTMREVGLILDATAESLVDGLIELNCEVKFVGDPVWKDYGMRIPVAPDGSATVSPSDVVYYDLKMEQPFFSTSSADTRLCIEPGTTLALETGSNTDTKDGRMAVFFLTVRKLDIVEQK